MNDQGFPVGKGELRTLSRSVMPALRRRTPGMLYIIDRLVLNLVNISHFQLFSSQPPDLANKVGIG